MKLFLSDLALLARLFNGKSTGIQVFEGKAKLTYDFRSDSVVRNNSFQVNISGKRIRKPLGKILVDFHNHNLKYDSMRRITFGYINNTDGTMRYIFPLDLDEAIFLHFDHPAKPNNSRRNGLINFLFKAGLKKIALDGKFAVYHHNKLYLEEILQYFSFDSYAIYMGKTSSEQKILITTISNHKPEFFVKLAVGGNAISNIINEYKILRSLNRHTFKYFSLPGCLQFEDQNFIILRNIASRDKIQVENKLTKRHLLAMNEIYQNTFNTINLSDASFLQEAKTRIQYARKLLQPQSNANIRSIISLAGVLADDLSERNTFIPVGLMHGDFTPWNLFSEQKLKIIGWEMAANDRPLLHDLFHFIVQSELQYRKADFWKIKAEIDRLYQHDLMKAIQESYQIDYFLHFQLYWLNEIAWHLPLMLEYGKKSTVNPSLVKIWSQALNQLVPTRLPVHTSR